MGSGLSFFAECQFKNEKEGDDLFIHIVNAVSLGFACAVPFSQNVLGRFRGIKNSLACLGSSRYLRLAYVLENYLNVWGTYS